MLRTWRLKHNLGNQKGLSLDVNNFIYFFSQNPLSLNISPEDEDKGVLSLESVHLCIFRMQFVNTYPILKGLLILFSNPTTTN